MLSPPSRMWSPTATRSSARLPRPSSTTAMREKSVVPPPMSQTRTVSPGLELLAPAVAGLRQPGVEGGLRLLEQGHLVQARLLGGRHGQLARHRVEGGGHRQVDLLLLEGIVGVGVVPGGAQVLEVERGGLHRRDALAGAVLLARRRLGGGLQVGAPPGQDGGVPVDAGVAQPGLGRGDQPVGQLGAALAGQGADGEGRPVDPGQARAPRAAPRARWAAAGRRAGWPAPPPRPGSPPGGRRRS